jgi:hypothetical protein
VDAVGGFFNCIDRRIGPGSDYEEKRRVSEALPALFGIDTERAKKIARVLRNDWDQESKGPDNRRRVVEAIARMPKPDHAFVEEMLRLVDGDDQYVVLACAEVLSGLPSSWNRGQVDKLFNQRLITSAARNVLGTASPVKWRAVLRQACPDLRRAEQRERRILCASGIF